MVSIEAPGSGRCRDVVFKRDCPRDVGPIVPRLLRDHVLDVPVDSVAHAFQQFAV